MTHARSWKDSSPPATFSYSEPVLPLLPTILVSVLAGIVAAGLALSAGYGIFVIVSCYVFVGTLVSFLLSLAFHRFVILGAASHDEMLEQSLSEGGVNAELDELSQYFLRELEWLVDNTALGLHEGSQVMFVAGETKEARDIRDLFMGEAGFSVRESCNLQDATLIILDTPERWDLLCIDVDEVGDTMQPDILAEQLLSFREATSSVPVMLMSRSFSSDRSHLFYRPSIADGWLRIPATDSSMLRALRDTYINNRIWQSC
ncbi:hypothetical protein [Yoonia sp. R2-816]|uniref:hypothetical protein n=1 Tax=Yoonia sp. R2-816 TaxID=3342638 RepID=UPI0037265F8A